MKNLLSLALVSFLIFTTFQLQSQTAQIPKWRMSTRLGLNTFTGFNLQLDRHFKENLSFELYLGYNYKNEMLKGGGLFCYLHSLNRVLQKRGPVFKLGIVKHSKNFNTHTFSLDYKGNFIHGFVRDDGCFSGSSVSYYSKSDWSVHDFGVSWYGDWSSKPMSKTSFFLGAGIGARNQTGRTHSAGPFNNQLGSSNPDGTTSWRVAFYIDMGLRVNFLNLYK